MADSPNLALPYLAAAQAQKHVTINEALRRLDALVHLSVADRTRTDAPPAPVDGQRHLVAAGATGAFAGQAGQIAAFQDGAWAFLAPRAGWLVHVEAENLMLVHDGAGFAALTLPTSVAQLGINTSADGTNRFAAASAASLFTHAGAGHQMKINKATAADTASLLYQTNFSGRAEFGLAGQDDFSIKVSADGILWREALRIDRASGAIALPGAQGGIGAGQNLLVNGHFAINQRAFAGGALAANAYGFDRWRAGAAGATLARAGDALTLSAGALVQTLDPARAGRGDFAGALLTVSVEDLTGGALSVQLGAQGATLPPSPGRAGATLTLGAGETGAVALQISLSGAAATFRRVKVELGPFATPWRSQPDAEALAECRIYFQRLANRHFTVGSDVAASRNIGGFGFAPMRAAPAAVVAAGGLLGQHALAPIVAAGPSTESLALAFTGTAYRSGFSGLGFATLDLSADI